MRRWRAIAVPLLAGMALSFEPGVVSAEEPSVPLDLQAQLTAKIFEYVESPPLGGGEQLPLGILVNARDANSMRAATALRAAFARISASTRRTFDTQIVEWASGAALAEEIARRKVTVLYLTPGLSAELGAVVSALDGRRVLTIAAVDSYVAGGAILGYELSSGHPRMILNLRQAKRQDVFLRAALIKLVRIVE